HPEHPGQHLVEPAQLGAESDEAFRNEVSALSSLTHPNLIRIFDFGVIREADPPVLEKRRFFTMELIRGTDSHIWSAAVATQKERERLLELLLLQALSVLSYVHREGIIHFDIKPQNLVLVGEQGASAVPLLKLTDFGFAKQQDETTDVQVRGTLEYTAPEMIRGQAFDTRVDLYSLGATFFHLIEGHCPFEAASPVDLVKRVLTEEPAFKAEASPDGRRLRQVLLKLLAKDPQTRFRDAEEAARSLVADMPKGKELLESYFGLSKQPKFVGRKPELLYLTESLSMVGKGQPLTNPAIVISGGEGIGKSSLLRQAIKVARALELPVFESETIQNDIPFSGVARILQLLISEVRSFSQEGKDLFARNQIVLGLQQQITTETLQFWAQEKEKFVELIARFILEASALFPFVLVTDNIQLMDEQSVGVLRTVIRDVNNGNIILLAGETAETARILPATLAHEISLGELSQDEVTDMSVSVLGQHEVSKSVGSSVYEMYGGTPVIIVEALSAVGSLLPKEALYDAELGKQFMATFESQLPRDIDDFILARYRKLGRERQLILSILSCFQNPASSALVVNVLPFHKQRSLDQLRYLQLDGFVGASETNELLMIRMKRLKDAIYVSIANEHHDLHSLVAAALESSPGENSFTQLQELGFQFAKSGDTLKAAKFYEQAADEGLRLFAFQRSLQLFGQAAKLAASSGDVGREIDVQT
ncbi:MAG: protein kinase, partial [bacterium]